MRLLSLRQVLELTTLSKTHTYRLMNWGKFPRPVKLGPSRVAWRESDVQGWMGERVEAEYE